MTAGANISYNIYDRRRDSVEEEIAEKKIEATSLQKNK
jgi:hypothetical protein